MYVYICTIMYINKLICVHKAPRIQSLFGFEGEGTCRWRYARSHGLLETAPGTLPHGTRIGSEGWYRGRTTL